MSRQPEIKMKLIIEYGDYVVELPESDLGISTAKTEKTAWKYAAKRLQKLADEAQKNYEDLCK